MASTVTSGQTVSVPSGGSADYVTVYDGGSLEVLAGGMASNITLSGGREDLAGIDRGLVAPTGFQLVSAGGVAYGATLAGFALQFILSGGVASDTHEFGNVDANDVGGGYSNQIVGSGGLAVNTLLNVGGLQTVYGEADGTQGSGRANAVIDKGTLAYSATNYALSASLAGFGDIVVTGGAHLVISDINAGPLFGSAYTGAAFIEAYSELELATATSLQSGTVIFGNGNPGTLQIDGTVGPAATVANFVSGNKIILNGLSISGAQVSDGLVQLFETNGGEYDLRIADVFPGGVGITTGVGDVVLSSYFQPTVFQDGDVVSDTQANFELGENATVAIAATGIAQDAAVNRGSTLQVQSGGMASGTFVGGGGVENVQAGGQSLNAHVLYGGQQTVDQDGTSYDPVVNGGMLVDNGTVSFGNQTGSPGSAQINALSGSVTVAVASGTVIQAGDASGFNGVVVVQGRGTYVIMDGTSLNSSASVLLSGGGSDPTVEFDDQLSRLPGATISGFAAADDVIDLRALSANPTSSAPYAAMVQAFVTSDGSYLNVISAGTTYSLNLDSGTTGSGPLNLVADGSGGTDITFSTLSAGTATQLTSAIDAANASSSGTFTVFLTADVTASPDPIQASHGATIVLDGAGFALTPTMAGNSLVTLSGGPAVVEGLGGSVGFVVTGGARVAVTSDTFDGGVTLSAGALEVVDAGGAGGGAITFDPAGGAELLTVDAAAISAGQPFAETLVAFGGAANQAIDLAGFTFIDGETSGGLVSAGTVLSVTNGTLTDTFALLGGAAAYHVFDDANGGTIVTADSVACYLTGTRILTETGERAVETLAIGDRVVTANGASRPIRWIGHRSYSGRMLAGRPALWPVCVRAGALAEGVPSRDLSISPRHALLLDGVLVPAEALVNGVSIVRVCGLPHVGYWHVELGEHDALLAEGAAAESFVDDDSRGMFHNASQFAALYPDRSERPAVYCAARVECGPVLDTIRCRLAGRASFRSRAA